MKQRVVIAIALACNPKLLIADEPTTALDVTIQAQVLELMNELKEKYDTSMIMITHDLGIVAQTCDNVAVMYAGALIEQAGLKGMSVGGAEVSTLHAGFIINKGGATSEDVKRLIELVQERVYENSGVTLETEVKFIGR